MRIRNNATGKTYPISKENWEKFPKATQRGFTVVTNEDDEKTLTASNVAPTTPTIKPPTGEKGSKASKNKSNTQTTKK